MKLSFKKRYKRHNQKTEQIALEVCLHIAHDADLNSYATTFIFFSFEADEAYYEPIFSVFKYHY